MITEAALLLGELVALFFGVAFAIQLFQRRLGPERLRSWMGGTPVASALKGIAVGFVTPFCTYSAIPMLVGLRQAGVPPLRSRAPVPTSLSSSSSTNSPTKASSPSSLATSSLSLSSADLWPS